MPERLTRAIEGLENAVIMLPWDSPCCADGIRDGSVALVATHLPVELIPSETDLVALLLRLLKHSQEWLTEGGFVCIRLPHIFVTGQGPHPLARTVDTLAQMYGLRVCSWEDCGDGEFMCVVQKGSGRIPAPGAGLLERFSQPGDTVIDPLCVTGWVLSDDSRQGRNLIILIPPLRASAMMAID